MERICLGASPHHHEEKISLRVLFRQWTSFDKPFATIWLSQALLEMRYSQILLKLQRLTENTSSTNCGGFSILREHARFQASTHATDKFLSLAIQRFDSYFNFYFNVCAGQISSEHALRTHQDLLNLVQFMKQESLSTRSQIRSGLASDRFRLCDNTQIDRSLDLALRLWLMVSAGDHTHFIPGQTLLSWHDDESYLIAISRRFPKVANTQLGKFSLSPALTACNLVRLGGFPIKWTCNLVDHLMLTNSRLHICHPVSVFEALETRYPCPCHL